LGTLAELTGLGLPISVLPFVNDGLAGNRVFARSLDELRAAGVRVLYGPGSYGSHPVGAGGPLLDAFPWQLALDALR
jgi:hypothetical protein